MSYSLMQSMVPPKVSEAIGSIPLEWRDLEEHQLVEAAFGGWEKVFPLDISLRRNFWVLYPKALLDQEALTTERLYRGVCSQVSFYKFLTVPKRVAFMVCEPRSEKQNAEHLLFLSWQRMREVLETRAGYNNRTGLTDTKLMDLQLKIFQYLDQRQNGKLIERHHHQIDQKTLQVNMSAEEAAQVTQLQSHLTPAEIDARIAQLETQQALPPGRPQLEVLDAISHSEKVLRTTQVSVEAGKKKR